LSAAPAPNQTQAQSRLRLKLILAGLLLYLLFMLVQMPAAWLIARLPASSPVQMGQASGTPWRGEVEHLRWQVEGERIELGRLSWRWLPTEILNGRIGIQFQLVQAANQLNGIVLLGRKGHALKQVQGQVDAALLGYVSRPFGLLQPQGSLVLDIADLFVSAKRLHGAAQIDWNDARSSMVAAPMGNYRASLRSDPDGRRARIEVTTLQGPLALNGQAEYLPGKNAQGSLRLTPPQGEAGAVFKPLLGLLGRPNPEGSWLLNFNTN
jgi:hypothetical protein